MRSLGGTMQQRARDDESQARWESNQAGNRGSPPDGGAPQSSTSGSSPGPRNTGPNPASGGGSSPGLTPPSAGGGASSSNPGSGAPTNPGNVSTPLTSRQGALTPGIPGASEDGARHGGGLPAGSMPPPQAPSVSPMGAPIAASSPPMSTNQSALALVQDAANVVGTLPSPLGERVGAFASLYSDPPQQAAAARAAVDAFNQVNARGQGFPLGIAGSAIYDVDWQGSAWDRSMVPVIASARQGLPLETMAQDAGRGGNVAGFLADRMLDSSGREPSMQLPAQQIPWHPQIAPHDWEIGAAVSNALGNRITQGAAARVYHEIRSPETGGGWSAGAQFIQTVQEIFQRPPTDPIAALEARLGEMEARGVLSQRVMTLWRANIKGRS